MIAPKHIAVVAGLALGVAALAATEGVAASRSAAASTTTVNIGDVVPLTGPLASFGPSFYKAGQIAVSEANAAAKSANIPMTFTIASGDEGSGPTSAVSAARQLESNGLSCLLGGTSTADSVAMAQAVTIPSSLTQISPAASSSVYGAEHAKGGLTFRTIQDDNFQAKVLAYFMAKQLGGATGKLVAVGGRNDSYGGPATAAFAAAWKSLGGKVTGPVLYDPNALSFDSVASQLVAKNPVAFVIEDFPQTYAKVGAALLRTGKFNAKNLYTTSGFPATIPSGTPAAALDNAWVIQPGQPTSGPVIAAYNKLYASFNASPKAQQPYNANNFDAAMLCILGAVAARSSSGSAIAKKIEAVSAPPGTPYTYLQLAAAFKALWAGKDINFQGVSGSLDLDSNGDVSGGLININRYVKNNLKLIKQANFVNDQLVPAKG
jgi:ABC-type branched-subunit amino acid transport system substrate-binding protein